MKNNQRTKNIWIGVTILLLLLVHTLLFFTLNRSQKQYELISHTDSVIQEVKDFNRNFLELSSAYRNQLLTTSPYFDSLYDYKQATLEKKAAELRRLTADNVTQFHAVDTLSELLKIRLSEFNRAVRQSDSMKSKPFTDSLLILSSSPSMPASILATTNRIENREKQLLSQRSGSMETFNSLIIATSWIIFIMALGIILWVTKSYANEAREKLKAEKLQEEYHSTLENKLEELQTAYAELEELKEHEKFSSTGRIARVIGHEIRNPLTNINLAAEELKDQLKEPDQEELLAMINRNSDRIGSLVSNLLNSTKQVDTTRDDLHINHLLTQVAKEAGDRIKLNNVTLNCELDEKDPIIVGDEAKLKIALTNLVVNAIEAMRQTTSKNLLLKTETAGDHCRITVKDSGMGMSTETQSKIFEPFYTEKSDGNGLGLTNTRNIIRNSGGKIKVNSELFMGTEMVVTMPLSEAAAVNS